MGCSGSRAVEPNTRRGGGGYASGNPAAVAAAAAASASDSSGGRRLRLPAPWQSPETQTASQLAQKRETFWGSQSSGAAVVWSNLRVASEALLAGDVDLAATVLDAADIRVPGGELSLAYDATGRSYVLPLWVFSSPTNLVSEAEMTRLTAARHRDHVGPVTELPVICRMSSSGQMLEQDVKMTLKSNTTVAELKSRLHALLLSGEVDETPDSSAPPGARRNQWRGKGLPPARQRIMYRFARTAPTPSFAWWFSAAPRLLPCAFLGCRGRELKDASHMQESNVAPGSFIQVFIVGPPQ